jgi:hypothetical protein
MANASNKLVTLIVGTRDCGVWDSHSGGGATINNGRHRPGGMRAERMSKGLKTYDDVTVTRAWYPEEGDAELEKWIDEQGGAVAKVIVTDLDENAAPLKGKQYTRTYMGRVGGVDSPESDSESDDTATWTVTVNVGSRA